MPDPVPTGHSLRARPCFRRAGAPGSGSHQALRAWGLRSSWEAAGQGDRSAVRRIDRQMYQRGGGSTGTGRGGGRAAGPGTAETGGPGTPRGDTQEARVTGPREERAPQLPSAVAAGLVPVLPRTAGPRGWSWGREWARGRVRTPCGGPPAGQSPGDLWGGLQTVARTVCPGRGLRAQTPRSRRARSLRGTGTTAPAGWELVFLSGPVC